MSRRPLTLVTTPAYQAPFSPRAPGHLTITRAPGASGAAAGAAPAAGVGGGGGGRMPGGAGGMVGIGGVAAR